MTKPIKRKSIAEDKEESKSKKLSKIDQEKPKNKTDSPRPPPPKETGPEPKTNPPPPQNPQVQLAPRATTVMQAPAPPKGRCNNSRGSGDSSEMSVAYNITNQNGGIINLNPTYMMCPVKAQNLRNSEAGFMGSPGVVQEAIAPEAHTTERNPPTPTLGPLSNGGFGLFTHIERVRPDYLGLPLMVVTPLITADWWSLTDLQRERYNDIATYLPK